MRKVLPILTTIMVALAGCTTNRTPGNGQPVTDRPYFNPVNTYGTSSGNVPMTSSYLAPTPTTSSADRAAYAAEVMRQHQLYQPRLLGYLAAEPQAQQQPAQDYATGQFINPSMTANPEITVNSSLSSQPTEVITGGAVISAGTATTGAATTAASTVGATTGATGATTVNAIMANGQAPLTPTVSSGAVPSPIAVSGVNVGLTPAGMASATTPTTTTRTTAPSTANAVRLGTARLTLPTTSTTNATSALTVTTTPSGRLMITNVHR